MRSRVPHYVWLAGQLNQAAPRVIPLPGRPGAWGRLKFVLRGLLYGAWVEPWYRFLNRPDMQQVATNHRLWLKVQWPYMNRSYGASKRLELLLGHYHFLLTLSPQLQSRLLSQKSLTLTRVNLRSWGTLALRLSHQNRFGQEGEMILDLYHEDSERACAAFCFSVIPLADGGAELLIGCLQGTSPLGALEPTSNKELIAGITREMHALRPKNLLLFTLRRMAIHWGVTKIRAVSTEMQLWKEKVQADYNEFWKENGGTPEADGMYEIPVSAAFKDVSERKANKRSLYRRRYQFMEALARDMEATLTDPERTPEPVELIQLQLANPCDESS